MTACMCHVTLCSDELVQHISTQLIPQIQQTEEACNELDAAASQAGKALYYVCMLSVIPCLLS